ncbi:MAG: hypothetical protein ACP5XB_25570, partial [Isosphaeraceae bacterium]
MSKSPSLAPAEAGQPDRSNLHARFMPARLASTAVGTVIILALGLVTFRWTGVRAEGAVPADEKSQAAADSADQSGFLAPIRRSLREQHDRMIDIANQLTEQPGRPDELESQLAIQRLKIDSAKASFKHAQLVREAAEFEVKEFEKRDIAQEEARTKEKLELARKHLALLRRRSPQAKERRRLIEQATHDANIDVAPLVSAELEEKKAELEVQQAQSEVEVATHFHNARLLDRLRSAVDTRKSNEAVKRASWEQEKANLQKLQERAHELTERTTRKRDPHDRQALAALDHAIPVEEQLRAKLEQIGKSGTPDHRVPLDVASLLDQLRARVDEAVIERTAARFAELKADFKSDSLFSKTRGPARAGDELRASSKVESLDPASPSFAAEARWRLKAQEGRMINLANQLAARRERIADLEDWLTNLEISVQGAEASFQNAKLTREVAEIAIAEYNEGIFVQDRVTLEGECKLAESDRLQKQDVLEHAKAVRAKYEDQSNKVPADKVRESRLADWVATQDIELRQAEIALAEKELKLKILVECTKPKHLKELQAAVEKARVEELTRRADWEREQSRAKALRAAVKAGRSNAAEGQAREDQDRRTRAALGRAIPIADQLRTKLEEVTPNAPPDDRIKGEIRDLSNQLDALLD